MNKHEWDMVFGFETLLREYVRNTSDYAKQTATAHLQLDGANRLFFFFLTITEEFVFEAQGMSKHKAV